MRKKELIKALSKIEEGIADVKNLLLLDDQVETAQNISAKIDTKEEVSTQSNEDDTEVQSNGAYTREDLLAMKYNDLKKLGKESGIKCTGTRDEIIDKILAIPMTDFHMVEPVEDEAEEEEKSNVVPMKKKSVKKEEPVEDTDDEDEEDDEIEEQYLAMAREALEDNDLEDIVEVLAEAGIKLSKLQAKKEDVVMTKLAEAFQNGMIEAEGEEDEEADVEDEDSTEDELEFSEDSYFDQYDPEGINDPQIMSNKRAKAVKSLVADIINRYEEEELTTEDIESELEDIVTDEDIELLGEDYSEEELVAFYIEMKKRFVDNDGNICEPSDPYEIGEDNFCCGHQLQYDKKGKKYVCPICEEEYEE